MGQEIVAIKDGFLVSERSGSALIIGAKIKFLDGVYKVEKVQVLPPETELVALDVTTCWVKWKGHLPVEHRVTQPGQVHPHRDDLPDQDESKWEPGLDGEPADCWRDTRYLLLVHPLTGAQYTFISDSTGGRIGISRLKDQIRNIRFAQPHAVPLIRLGSAPFKTRYGTKVRPDFEVLEWRNKESQQQLTAAELKENAPIDDEIPL